MQEPAFRCRTYADDLMLCGSRYQHDFHPVLSTCRPRPARVALIMDLFAAAGINLGGSRKGQSSRAGVSRTLKLPLLKHKVVAEALKNCTFDFSPRQVEAATRYARTVRSRKFARRKETAVRPLFCQEVLGEFLGYTQ